MYRHVCRDMCIDMCIDMDMDMCGDKECLAAWWDLLAEFLEQGGLPLVQIVINRLRDDRLYILVLS